MGIRSADSVTPFPSTPPSSEPPVEDEEVDEVAAAAPVRLAGAGAALGACFSVMIVVVALGSAAMVSEPRTGRAEVPAPAQAAPMPEGFHAVRNGFVDVPLDSTDASLVRFTLTIEQRLELEGLERRVCEARAGVDEARTRLTLKVASRRRQAVAEADSARRRAEQAQVHTAQLTWMTPDDFATVTRTRALGQLRSEAQAAAALEAEARAELARRQQQAGAAEEALAAWLAAHAAVAD